MHFVSNIFALGQAEQVCIFFIHMDSCCTELYNCSQLLIYWVTLLWLLYFTWGLSTTLNCQKSKCLYKLSFTNICFNLQHISVNYLDKKIKKISPALLDWRIYTSNFRTSNKVAPPTKSVTLTFLSDPNANLVLECSTTIFIFFANISLVPNK